jgi:hypothetical protein
MGMRVGVFGVPECVEPMTERRAGLRSLSGVIISSLTSSAVDAEPAFDPARRCWWLADGRCRQGRAGSVLIADSEQRWEIPAHPGPVVVGPRGELVIDRLTDPARLLESRDARVADKAAEYEGRPAVVIEVESLDSASVHDRLLTLDAEFGVVLIEQNLVTGREIRLTDVRFNEEADPELFVYRPEPWRTLVHAQPC